MAFYCVKCGNSLAPDTAFCRQCGNVQEPREARQTRPLDPGTQPQTYKWMDQPSPPPAPPARQYPQNAGHQQPHLPPPPPQPRGNTDPSYAQCPFCRETIMAGAIKCRFCGEIVDVTRRNFGHPAAISVPVNHIYPYGYMPPIKQWSPGLAALLSFLIPGLGQIYKGQVGIGIVWLIFTIIGYAVFVVPGLILHIICIATAASGDPYRR